MRKHKRFKKILLVMVLIGALLGVQVMEIVAYAAEEGGTAEPVMTVRNKEELLNAILTASDGDTIGISELIRLDEEFLTIGDEDKQLNFIRMNHIAAFEITATQVTIQNVTIDGANIGSWSSMITVNVPDGEVTFMDVTMKNCVCHANGGAIHFRNGNAVIYTSTFTSNQGTAGGHISVRNSCRVDLMYCNFEKGTASAYGGAIDYCSSSGCRIASCVITNNFAPVGGGIYNDGFITINDSKIYDNQASNGGADIANTDGSTFRMEDDIEKLVELFKSDGILPKGWVNDYDQESGATFHQITPSFENSLMKLDYEEIVEEPEQPTEPSVPDDGNDGDQEEPTDPDTGEDTTDPSQPDDGDQDAGETSSDPTTPDDSEDPSTPTEPGDSETPSEPSDPGGTPDEESGDGAGSSGDNITTDNSDHSSNDDNSTTNTDNSSNDTTNTDNSDHSSIKEDNSVTNTNSGNTTNSSSDHSQRTEDNSSVIYNYYYPSENNSKEQEQHQPQQIVIHNYIQDDSESKETVKSDPMGNVSIDAEGVDVSFEVKDGVYSISIKAKDPEPQVQQATEEPASETSMLNWYEIIKIGLLGAIVFVVKKK